MVIIKNKDRLQKLKIICCTYLYIQSKKRKYWVHPYLKNKARSGCYKRVVLELEKYPQLYYTYFRMDRYKFMEILKYLESSLQPKATNYRESIHPKEKLVVTLRFLASGWTLKDLGLHFFLGHSTVHKIVIQTLKSIKNLLMPIAIPYLKDNDWIRIRKQFYKKWNFPSCLGALDGKHIDAFAFKNSGSQNFNYKKRFSLVLMALVDADYRFLMVDIGGYGSMSDSTIFSQSSFGKMWLSNDQQLNLPNNIPLPNQTEKVPNIIIADEAFGLKETILRPFPGKNLTDSRRIFNYRLSRARRVVESAFGICAQTWRILLKRIENNSDNCKLIVTACVTLHNFLRMPVVQQNFELNTNLDNNLLHTDRKFSAFELREHFSEWCSNAGKVPWQNNMLLE